MNPQSNPKTTPQHHYIIRELNSPQTSLNHHKHHTAGYLQCFQYRITNVFPGIFLYRGLFAKRKKPKPTYKNKKHTPTHIYIYKSNQIPATQSFYVHVFKKKKKEKKTAQQKWAMVPLAPAVKVNPRENTQGSDRRKCSSLLCRGKWTVL